jgi:acyl dehydratase
MVADPARLAGLPFQPIRQSYGWRDSVIYALGLGIGLDPLVGRQLRFVTETDLQAVPAMASVLGYPGFWLRDMDTGLDWARIVHGEQYVRLHRPLSPGGEIVAMTRVTDVVDKGADKGALIYAERTIRDAADDTPIATIMQVYFCRGDGGFEGGSAQPPVKPHAMPERAPDLHTDRATSPQAALIYRLSGDINPLHADPAIARKAGFERPILHGLATYGVACYGLVEALCDGEAHRVRALDCRFSAPVFPGDTIRIDIWKEGPGKATFRAGVNGRGTTVLNNGYFEYEA